MKLKKYSIFATCYDKRGRIIARGENNYNKTHPIMQQLSIRHYGKPIKKVLHAEVAAILKCGDQTPYRIFVERYRCDSSIANAKPCPICMDVIKLFGVKQLWYTDIHGKVVKEKLK